MATLHTTKPGYFGKGSVEVTPPTSETEGGVRRLAITADRLVTQPFEGLDTLPDIIDYAARTFGSRDAVGWREVVDVITEEKEVKKVVGGNEVTEKKQWKYFQLSPYTFISAIEFKQRIVDTAKGLLALGIGSSDIFNVYANTCANWQIVAQACNYIGTTIATAYATLGEAGLQHSLNEPECVGLFTNAELLRTLYNVLGKTTTVKFIIYDGKVDQKLVDDLHAVREDIRVVHIDELQQLGKDVKEETLAERRPTRESVACIMYTSGSTGAPKGVVLTHHNLVSSVGAVYVLLGHHLTQDDTYIAYLPLAHVLEYIVQLSMLFAGVHVGFAGVKTLTDQSVRNCKGDIAELRPTIMVGVPAVWEMIRKGVLAKVNQGSALKKGAFHGSMKLKKNNVPILGALADNLVLSQIRQATGGRLRVGLAGGAAISRDTQEFFNVAIFNLLSGYGMTESCGMCAVLPPENMRYDCVGLPMSSIEVKLIDVPDAGYSSKNDPPTGEVCIRGPSVTKGYYKRPDLNEDPTIFTPDGWLRTGDVGQWNPDGTLSLIDRIKNLVKLSGGEYIALERLEAIYKACNLVSNMCVYANSDMKQPLAIIIPHEAHLRARLETLDGVDAHASLPELCKNKKVMDLVLKECVGLGKKNDFKPLEILQAVILTGEEWTPENGMVTAAQKINRSGIAKKFKSEIDVRSLLFN
ncbi:long-chain-fatty-acid-CoA-ligase [Cylindrobasidium torrendii FP15055 ss-10]|uniref:Long-chain-fatty-acid-CoA-ligase n=1 Tax=Cylindrobasidium torrendii FP15055 ss-10 TaxID=1314674 RepID=A0A0D7BDH0_9AGAR|nr:long-chain-fatty-acid-CoA-ligase [Cylindrobasidium torrendii FP15055 ss-10]